MSTDFTQTWGYWALTAAIMLGVVILISATTKLLLNLLGRKLPFFAGLGQTTYWPLLWTLISVVLYASVEALPLRDNLLAGLHQILTIAIIGTGAWWLTRLILFFIDEGTAHIEEGESDEFGMRRRRTQLRMVRRLISLAIALVAIGSALMTFPAVRSVGTSLLASAGIASIVAGLAAQSVLGNLLAGVQLAFNEAIREGDLVVVQGTQGTIRSITLSYVVIDIWDQRSLVVPCTYFTTTPFENWTKSGDKLLGAVLINLTWQAPLDEMRAELNRLVDSSPWWDGRRADITVSNTLLDLLEVRVVVSAATPDDLSQLRNSVRENLVEWLRTKHPEVLPQPRLAVEPTPTQSQ